MNVEKRKRVVKRALGASGLVLLGSLGVGWWQFKAHLSSLPIEMGLGADSASEGSRWPWLDSRPQVLGRGVQAWSKTTADGSLLLLQRFDFGANPRLQFSIVDNDQADAVPGDNLVKYWPHGVAQITKSLNTKWLSKSGKHWQGTPRQVLAASNGAFFGYANKVPGPSGIAFHVGPVVLDGKIAFNGANHRWTFGTKIINGQQVFDVVHLPSREQLGRFRWAAGSVQCLVKAGQPLKLQAFPKDSSDYQKQPVASTPAEAGHIPLFDHMRTCRVSLAWSRDSKVLWWLVVKEPDIESGSAIALKRGLPIGGGWTVPDVQRFWLSLRQSEGDMVWSAINSDAGDVAQMIWKTPSSYEMIPPRWADKRMRLRLKPGFTNAALGGPIMAFVVSG